MHRLPIKEVCLFLYSTIIKSFLESSDLGTGARFGKEDTAKELQDHAAKTQDTLVDAVENAEVAEIKRAVFRPCFFSKYSVGACIRNSSSHLPLQPETRFL